MPELPVHLIYFDWNRLEALGREEGRASWLTLVTCGEYVGDAHPEVYETVYETTGDGDDPEAICNHLFEQFNIGDRGGLRVRSMSVGDVVEVGDRRFICKGIGWAEIIDGQERPIPPPPPPPSAWDRISAEG
jgi:hypothetical protein